MLGVALWQQVRIATPTGPANGTQRDLRFGAVRERQVVVINTAYRGASFKWNITSAAAGMFQLSGAVLNGTALLTLPILYNANATQLCAAMAPIVPLNGCRADQLRCTASAVRR